jgi:hypothetical protein
MWSSFRPHLGLLLCSALLASCGETIESSYTTLAAARQDGAIARGWLPPYLPQSATSLRERHNLDSNQSLLAFTFDPAETFMNSAPCVAVSESETPLPPNPGSVRWWPKSLLSTRRGGLRLFRFTETGSPGKTYHAWLALDNARGEAFFWRTAR